MILNRLGHAFGDNQRKIAVPVKTEVRRNNLRTKNGKPILRMTAGMQMRNFYKVRENGEILAYTPKAVNNNPKCPNTFFVGLYQSPTGVFIPKGARDDQ